MAFHCMEVPQFIYPSIEHLGCFQVLAVMDKASIDIHIYFPNSSAGKESACNAGNPGSRRSPVEGTDYPLQCSWASLVAQMVKNQPAMWETWVPSLSWEDPLEEGIAWRIPMDRGAWQATYSSWSCKELDVTE